MPATPSRIGFIQEPFRKVTAETAAIKTRHGNLARESEDPIETFFDNQADAQAICDARQALLGTERRRFQVNVADVQEVMAIPYLNGVPVAHYVDSAKTADIGALISEVIIDLGRESSVLGIWG